MAVAIGWVSGSWRFACRWLEAIEGEVAQSPGGGTLELGWLFRLPQIAAVEVGLCTLHRAVPGNGLSWERVESLRHRQFPGRASLGAVGASVLMDHSIHHSICHSPRGRRIRLATCPGLLTPCRGSVWVLRQ